MSHASESFAQSILDAENLLAHFDHLNTKPPPPELEVLKRAGLIMAMTAWETYVEDRVLESAGERLRGLNDASVATLVQSKLDYEIQRLHNPTSDKAIQLFRDYAGTDLTEKWCWNQHDAKTVRARLDQYNKLRGEVVHRSRGIKAGPPQPDAITRDKLLKAVRFLKALVNATEKGLLRT